MTNDIFRLSAEESFEQEAPDDEFYSVVDRSLNPRSLDLLYDKLGVLIEGNGDDRVLDVGCRSATHMCEIAERFGIRVSGIDLVDSSVRMASERIAERELADRVDVARGDIQSMDILDSTFDVVWCRDMLSIVPDLEKAFSECTRVLKSGGHMLIFTDFATDQMEPREAERLYGPISVVADNLSRSYFEDTFRKAGFDMVERDELGSEWREWREEEGDQHTTKQLLRIARMLRNRDELIPKVGRKDYEIELADCYWGVYHMIGKLSSVIYVLRKA